MNRFAVGVVIPLVLAAVPGALAQKGGRPTSVPVATQPAAEEAKKAKAAVPRLVLPEPAEWAPADALFFLGVTDVREAWTALQKTSAYAVLGDPSVAGAVPGPNVAGTLIEEFKTRLAGALDVAPDQLSNPFSGPAAFFLTAPLGAKPDELEPGLVAGVGDAALMKKYYDAAVAKLKTLGKHEALTVGTDTVDVFALERAKEADAIQREEDEFDELDADPAMRWADPDAMLKKSLGRLFAADSLPRRLALSLTAERLIVAGSAEHVQALLEHDASVKTIAGTSEFHTLLENLKPTGDIRFVVNLPRIIDMAPAAAGTAEARELRRKIKAWGLDGLGSVVGHCRLGAASYEWKIDALLLLAEQRTGVARLLSSENLPVAPAANVSADTAMYLACNLNVPQWLDELGPRLAGEGETAASWTEWQSPSGETVSLREMFFDHLVGPLTASLSIVRSPVPGVRLLLGIGHRDQAAVARGLSGPLAADWLRPREAQGAQVFDVGPLPFLPMPGLSLAATPDRLIVGNTAAVESALAPPAGPALRDTDTWKRAARCVPEHAWLTIYVDNRKLLDELLELANKPPEAAAPDLGTVILAGMMQSIGADASGLERLRRYSAQAVYTIATTPSGVRFTAVQLRP